MNFKKTFLMLFALGVLNNQLSATPLFKGWLYANNAMTFSSESPGIESRSNEISPTHIKLDYYFPEKIFSDSTFLLRCKISKGHLKGLVRLTQQLPNRFDVVESVVANAKTKYSDNTLSLMWEQIPNDSVFEISYNVLVNRSSGYLPISSVLYFEETGEKYFFNTHILIDKVRPTEDLNTFNLLDEENISLNSKGTSSEGEGKSVAGYKQGAQINNSGNMVYSIQILALKYSNIKPESLKNEYNINQEIIVEDYQNWRKYTIGKFLTVKEANFYLKQIRNKGMTDAFIVGFENGYCFIKK